MSKRVGTEADRARAHRRYSRDVHYEVVSGISVVPLGKRNTLAIIVYHFTDERDARRVGREHGRKVFRVDRQRREELVIRHAGTARGIEDPVAFRDSKIGLKARTDPEAAKAHLAMAVTTIEQLQNELATFQRPVAAAAAAATSEDACIKTVKIAIIEMCIYCYYE